MQLRNNYSNQMRLFFIMVLFVINLTRPINAFSSTLSITADTYEVQAASVTYTFELNLAKDIPRNGKLEVRFPEDYSSSPFEIVGNSCKRCDNTGNNCDSQIKCAYTEVARMITIENENFEISSGSKFWFTVPGLSNPPYARTAEILDASRFEIEARTYQLSLPEQNPKTYDRLDTMVDVFSAEAGALYNELLELSIPRVAAISQLTVSLTATHTIPTDGMIIITLPKWNSFAEKSADFESLISASTNPGEVSCEGTGGFSTNVLYCEMTRGAVTDTLRVKLEHSELEQTIAGGTNLEFTIQDCRSPPSLTPLDGFTFETVSSEGEQIDVSTSSSITLAAFEVATATPASVTVTSTNKSINVETNIELRVKNLSPLPANSRIEITIPDDFIIGENIYVLTVDYLTSQIDYDQASRKLVIDRFNTDALQVVQGVDITFGPVTNPGQTQATSSFTVELFDDLGAGVESISEGVTFIPIAGIFTGATTVEASDKLISAQDVAYTFTLYPTDSFDNTITLEVLYPKELFVYDNAYISERGGAMNRFASIDKILYNRKVLITNVLGDGAVYDANENRGIQFTMKGVDNPTSTAVTEPWSFALYYEEGTNEVTRYAGTDRTFQAEPSDQLTMRFALSQTETGAQLTKMTMTGSTEEVIQQGSYISLFIPEEFVVNDYSRVAASCSAEIITDNFGNEFKVGFSDQVTCEFDMANSSRLNGHFLNIYGGFASQDFEGGDFKFFIRDVLNPFTTEQTGAFDMTIQDRNGNLAFYDSTQSTLKRFTPTPSEFAYAYVESLSPVVGEVSEYSFSLTFGVDTPYGTIAEIDFPDEIQFPAISVSGSNNNQDFYHCQGTHTLNENLQCTVANERSTVINVYMNAQPDLSQEGYYFKNGTTVAFIVGFAKNPTSFQGSSSFRITTKHGVGAQKYELNRQTTGLEIKNTVRGNINNLDIMLVNPEMGKELSAATQVRISFETSNPIPLNGKLQVTLPKNMQVMQTDPQRVIINGLQNYSCRIDSIYQLLSCTMLATEENKTVFVIEILSQLYNPFSGPYTYEEFSIQFLTAQDQPIDGIVSRDPWIVQECNGNCIECQGNLDTCLKCGLIASTGIEYYLDGFGSCQENCSDLDPGLYNGDDYTCRTCEDPCASCERSPTACTKCLSGYANPLTFKCYETCPSGTYVDESEKVCLDCPSPGFTCESDSLFTSCDRTDPDNLQINYYGLDMQCYESCPPTSIQTPSKVCIACEHPCSECTDQTDLCSSCLDGYFLYKQECRSSCPMGYRAIEETKMCEDIGELDIPFPFSIFAFVLSIGLYISSWMKGADKQGKEREGTAYFLAIIACVDILLRLDWFILCVGAFSSDETTFFCFMLILCLITVILNLVVWRKYFHTRYRYDKELDPLGDKKYTEWMKTFPKTAMAILFLTYVVTFQAIRLSYSRLLGKKQFCATFTQKRRYYRLMGRISMLQIFVLYLPSIAFMIYGLYQFVQGTQIFYYAIDGLILTCYATILIMVVIGQREQTIGHGVAFEIKELFTCAEIEEEQDDDQPLDFDNMKKIKEVGELDSDVESKADCKSAQDYYELQKRPLFQNEVRDIRYRSIDAGPIEDPPLTVKKKEYHSQGVDAKTDKSLAKRQNTGVHARPVTVVNYDQYRKLEDKKERILLKKKLYLHKRETDRAKLQDLGKKSVQVKNENINIQRILRDLNNELTECSKQVRQENRNLLDETKAAERRKREATLKRTQSKEGNRDNSGKRRRSTRKRALRGKDFIRYNTNTAFSPTHREKLQRNNTQDSRDVSPAREGEDTYENSPNRGSEQRSASREQVRPPNQIYQDLIQQQLNQSSFVAQGVQRVTSANEPNVDHLLSGENSNKQAATNANNQQSFNPQHN